MPRPALPRAEDIARIARCLRSEGFTSFRIDATPDGHVSISAGEAGPGAGSKGEMTELDRWKAKRGAA